jgi:hypothetical protein
MVKLFVYNSLDDLSIVPAVLRSFLPAFYTFFSISIRFYGASMFCLVLIICFCTFQVLGTLGTLNFLSKNFNCCCHQLNVCLINNCLKIYFNANCFV